jgi:5-formyltetrahydrofolate cyclo-ligase
MDLEERKKALRQEIKAAAALDEGYTKEADLEIFSHVAGLLEYEQAGTLFCFVGTSGEIDTVPILEDALRKGKRVGVPKCTARGIMEVREIRSLGDLEAGKYGILEPGAEAPVIQPEEINLAIVPCMSCSHDGRRLGYGGGYYDRYLVRTRAVKAVICRERIMRADIPVEPHDQLMDMVISEHGVRRLGSR